MTNPPRPYADAAESYWRAGWPNPIPVRGKSNPPTGYTGYGGVNVSWPDLRAWLDGPQAKHNIAVRLPVGVIGIDVDAYGSKAGDTSLANAETALGPLPASPRSTSRGASGASGIRFYRLPMSLDLRGAERRFQERFGENVDILRHDHRYAMVWPSIHPETRAAYRWYDSLDVECSVPVMTELPELPAAWREFLAAPTPPTPPDTTAWDEVAERKFTVEQAKAFIKPAFDALRSASNGTINNRLNDAAVRLSHFIPDFWSRSKAERWLLQTVKQTAYDGQTWQAEATIASGLDAQTWRAELVEAPVRRADGAAPSGLRELKAISADNLTMKRPQWLDDWRIPANGITLLAGREGIGKSTISYDIAARVTRGELQGQHTGTPKGVAVVAGEDSWEHVILPRLTAAGANLKLVYRVEATENGRADTVSVPADLDRLGELCAQHEIVLIVLDPLMSVIHGSLDTYKDREVRQALDPLARFAAQRDVAVLGLIHVNKTATTDPLTSIMASRAFAAVARSVLYCMLDPDADGDDQYLYGHAKSNLGPKQSTIKYRVVTHVIPHDVPIETSRVEWLGDDFRSIREAMETTRAAGPPVGGLATDLATWIGEQGRTVSRAEILQEFGQYKVATVDTNLKRMVGRGTLRSPVRAHYVLVEADESVTTSVTPLETQEAKEGKEVSELLTDLSDLSSDRSTREVTDSACCQDGPLTPKCGLCDQSPNYWRNQREHQ